MRINPVFLFDLDGTLVDSVYEHVLAWKQALDAEGLELSVWRIHRKIGMSGGLFTNQLARETGVALDEARLARLSAAHAAAYRGMGATHPAAARRARVARLSQRQMRIPWAIATSGRMETAGVNLAALGVDPAKAVVVTRDQVAHAKPDPDLFLAAAARLGAPIETAYVIGDSIWDMLAAARCRALGIGLLSGGYGETRAATGLGAQGLRGPRRHARAYLRAWRRKVIFRPLAYGEASAPSPRRLSEGGCADHGRRKPLHDGSRDDCPR